MHSSIRQPLGILPRANVCGQPQEYAQKAENIDLTQAGWVPWRQPEQLLQFEHKVLSAHVHQCCWAGVPMRNAHYYTADNCGSRTYLSAEGEYPVVTEDFCAQEWTRLGFPVPPAPDVNVLDSSEPCDMMTDKRTYKLVYCSECEQGAGSSPSVAIEVNDKHSVVVSIPSEIDPCWGVTHVKVYRQASTWDVSKGLMSFDGDFNPGFADLGTESDYFYVGKVEVGASEFVDDVETIMGHSLRTDDFYPPKKGLRIVGETNLQSLVGFSGREVWFSERNAYWAFPLRARHNFPEPIQCIGVCQDVVIVVTRNHTYTIEDTVDCRDSTCRNVVESKESFQYCGTGSCCLLGDGLLYTTTEGLAYTRIDGSTTILTLNAFAKNDWGLIRPDQMRIGKGCEHIFLTTDTCTYALPLRLDESGRLGNYVSTLSFVPDEWITDEHDNLYFLAEDGAYSFNTGSQYMDMLWRQIDQTPGVRTRASAMKAEYENKKLKRGNGITLYRNGEARAHTDIANTVKRFRPVLAECHAIEVRGNQPMCALHYGAGVVNITNTQ